MNTRDAIIEKGMASYPAVYLVSSEEVRALGEIQAAAKELKRKMFVWTFGDGLREEVETSRTEASAVEDTQTPPKVLQVLRDQRDKRKDENQIIVLKDFHEYLANDPNVRAKLKMLIPQFKMQTRMLIVLSPMIVLPPDIEKDLALVEMALPTKEDLKPVLDAVVAGVLPASSRKRPIHAPNADTEKRLLDAALGLTTTEAENAFALSIIRPRIRTPEGQEIEWDPTVVMEEKCSTLKKDGMLQFYPPSNEGLKQVGGLQSLKEWINKRKKAFTDEAKSFGLPAPKGILTVGPPGTGKSLGAKAIAEELGLPLLRVDMGRIYAGIVGASEANVRRVILTAEAVAPCVLWFDELEKGMAGAVSGAVSDSGVGSRVLGTILTWMSEKTAPVFVYATVNNVGQLPPELLRKGRFDEVFSVDLPNAAERKEILQLHIRKRGRERLIGENPDNLDVTQRTAKIDLDEFVKETEGWSGAEIEGAIVDAMFSAFADGKDLNAFDLHESLASTRPLSTVMADEIDKIRKFCKDRTRPANTPSPVEAKVPVTKNVRPIMA